MQLPQINGNPWYQCLKGRAITFHESPSASNELFNTKLTVSAHLQCQRFCYLLKHHQAVWGKQHLCKKKWKSDVAPKAAGGTSLLSRPKQALLHGALVWILQSVAQSSVYCTWLHGVSMPSGCNSG